jgi:hypothetical protein
VYLPDTYQCNAGAEMKLPPPKTRSEYGLPEDRFVFCCFNNNFKILPEFFDVWMRLLANVEHSVLWLMADNSVAVYNLTRAAEERGIRPERLVFAPRVGLADHLARQSAADLSLDTLPYGAHTTASDALRVALPILTCRGASFAGRVAASLLHAIGAPELIAESLADYEALALRLARSPVTLGAIKEKLARNRRTWPLFDTTRFTGNLESAFLRMWERHRGGEPPISFLVEPPSRELSQIDGWHCQPWFKGDFGARSTKGGCCRAAFCGDVLDDLKPGGTYVIIDHATAPGKGMTQTETLHRSDPEVAKKEVLAVEFKLLGQSNILAHPGDDHTQEVFALNDEQDDYLLSCKKP